MAFEMAKKKQNNNSIVRRMLMDGVLLSKLEPTTTVISLVVKVEA